MPKPVCVPCQRFFRYKQNGYTWEERMPRDHARPGIAEPEKWFPYKIWQGDLMECKGCGAQIIVGHGAGPVAEHFEDEYADWAKHVQGKVNDC